MPVSTNSRQSAFPHVPPAWISEETFRSVSLYSTLLDYQYISFKAPLFHTCSETSYTFVQVADFFVKSNALRADSMNQLMHRLQQQCEIPLCIRDASLCFSLMIVDILGCHKLKSCNGALSHYTENNDTRLSTYSAHLLSSNHGISL